MTLQGFNALNKKTAPVLDGEMAYLDYGKGDPIVLLHGNPTSSYLWREVIPPLAAIGRCVAPDLIGMGDSSRVESGPDAYRFATHARYLEAFLEQVGVVGPVTLVGHDWGGPLAFDWGRRHADEVKGVALMETIVGPLSWDDWPEPSRRIFEGMRSKAGEVIILEKNVFVERILPSSVLTPLADDVMAEYRRPYLEPGESRRPTLTWPREIPFDGDPADVDEVVRGIEVWLSDPDLPKLFVNAKPGFLLTGRMRDLVRSWENVTEATVSGLHVIQEDSGTEIGESIARWMADL